MENDMKFIKKRYLFNNIFKIIIYIFSFISIIPLFIILFTIFSNGIKSLDFNFFTQVSSSFYNLEGGVIKDILGSLILVSLGIIFAVPISIFAGVFLADNTNNAIASFVSWTIEVMKGIPSIIVGITVAIIMANITGRSALAGAVALAVLFIPILITYTEKSIKEIPVDIKEAAISLGVPYYKVILKVIIPQSAKGILNGIIFGISRILGLAAPLLFTAGNNNFFSTDLFQPIGSLPVLIYNYGTSPFENLQRIAWGAAFILLMVILVLNITLKLVVKKWKI